MVQCSPISILVRPRASPLPTVIDVHPQLRCCSHRHWEGISGAGRGPSTSRRGCRADLESSLAFWTSQGQRPEFSISAVNTETCGESCKRIFPNLHKMTAAIYSVSLCRRCFSHTIILFSNTNILFNPQRCCSFMRWVRKMKTRVFNHILHGDSTSN